MKKDFEPLIKDGKGNLKKLLLENNYFQHQFLVKYLIFTLGLCTAIIIALSIAIANIYPLKEVQPYLIMYNTELQEVVTLKRSHMTKTQYEAVAEAYLTKYIREYMRIDPVTIFSKERIDFIKAFSSPEVGKIFSQYSNPKHNPEVHRYLEENKVKDIYVKTITRLEKNRWDLIIEARDYQMGLNGVVRTRVYHVTCRIENKDINITSELAKLNPLGIIVKQINISDYE